MKDLFIAAALIIAALVGTTSAASACGSNLGTLHCLFFDNHTDRVVVVEISTKVGTWAPEISPGRSDGIAIYDAILAQHHPAQGQEVFALLTGVCVRAHYRNPPTDAVKVEGSTDGRCLVAYPDRHILFSIEP
jgi:hypothetical protein